MSNANSLVSLAHAALLRISRALMAIAIALLALMAILVVLQVVARNGFDLGLPWADELARFSSISLVYLSMPLLALRGQHVAVDMLPQLLGGRSKVVLAAIAEIGTAVFCITTLFGMHAYLIRAGKFSTQALGLSNWLFYAPSVVGVALFGLVSLLRLVEIGGDGTNADTKPEGRQ
jgi:TRAP-type transport system small permease protein